MENQAEYRNPSDSERSSTLETIPQPSASEKRKTCRKHGEYNAKTITISTVTGNEITSACPQCVAERQERDRQLQEKAHAERIRRRIEATGIPPRFMGKRLENLSSKSVKQKAVFKSVSEYLEALKDGTAASVILCGKPGTGKTHIGCAIVVEVARLDKPTQYITTAQLMRAVKRTYRNDSEESEDDVIRFYGGLALLVVDEIGVQFGSDTERNIFHEVIDRRYGNMLPTVLISNLTADELKGFIGERAFDRFREDGGAVLAFDWESHRGK